MAKNGSGGKADHLMVEDQGLKRSLVSAKPFVAKESPEWHELKRAIGYDNQPLAFKRRGNRPQYQLTHSADVVAHFASACAMRFCLAETVSAELENCD